MPFAQYATDGPPEAISGKRRGVLNIENCFS